MIDFRDYNPGDTVRITCVDGEVLNGEITSLDDEEESGLGEDGISIFTEDGRYIGIGKSEIESVEILQ